MLSERDVQDFIHKYKMASEDCFKKYPIGAAATLAEVSDKSFHQGRGSAFSEVVLDLERLFYKSEEPAISRKCLEFSGIAGDRCARADLCCGDCPDKKVCWGYCDRLRLGLEANGCELLQDTCTKEDPGSGAGTDVHNVRSSEGPDFPYKLIDRIRDSNRY